MARNRQKAKERQARRAAERGGDGVARDGRDDTAAQPPAASEPVAAPEPQPDRDEVRDNVDLEVGAPPKNLGRSDAVIQDEPDLDDEPEPDDDEHFDLAEDQAEDDTAQAAGPRGRRGEDPSEHRNRPRLVQFLFAVRAELGRVQWPDRQALTTLTGVVLGFVLIAGGYLGALDAIFSRLIQAIL